MTEDREDEITKELVSVDLAPSTLLQALPPQITECGPEAVERFIEFFVSTIRNRNTREAYARAIARFFAWASDRRLGLRQIRPIAVSRYIEELIGSHSLPTVKQHLAAIRKLFDWLTTGHIVERNPAASVRGPRYSVRTGKTPVLDATQARTLLDSIESDTVVGSRDKALIAFLLFTFARVSAATNLKLDAVFQEQGSWKVRLFEKNSVEIVTRLHHLAKQYLDEYLERAHLSLEGDGFLFRSSTLSGELTDKPMSRHDVLRMIKRRSAKAGIPYSTCCHSFRATGITTFIQNGGSIETARVLAGHATSVPTKLYDRTDQDVSQDEVERIRI